MSPVSIQEFRAMQQAPSTNSSDDSSDWSDDSSSNAKLLHSCIAPLQDRKPEPYPPVPPFHCDDEEHDGPSLNLPKLHPFSWQNVIIDKPFNGDAGIVFWRTVVIDKANGCR